MTSQEAAETAEEINKPYQPGTIVVAAEIAGGVGAGTIGEVKSRGWTFNSFATTNAAVEPMVTVVFYCDYGITKPVTVHPMKLRPANGLDRVFDYLRKKALPKLHQSDMVTP